MFMQILYQLPMLLVYIAGIVLAIAFWGRQPRASMFALIGTAILLAVSILAPIVSNLSFQYWFRSSRPSSQYSTAMGVLAVIWVLVRASGYGLLFAAVYVGRRRNEMASGFPVAAAHRAAAPVAPPPPAGYRMQ